MPHQYLQRPGCISQCRIVKGRENGAVWEVNITNGKYLTPIIQTERDMLEGKACTLCQPKEGSILLPEISIAVL